MLGRNGAGKTTLFNCINRDIDVDGGAFYFVQNEEKVEVKPSDVGYVLSTPTVPEFLTGWEFIQFFIDSHVKDKSKLKPIKYYLDLVSMSVEDANMLMKDYSHGLKNKMQMVVNFISEPRLLLLDEPLTSLDVIVSEQMKEILRCMKSDRVTILSTHILDLALDFCDEIVLLNHGELELLQKENLEKNKFREKIIEALKE